MISSINIFKPSKSLTGGDTNGVKQHKNIKNREPINHYQEISC